MRIAVLSNLYPPHALGGYERVCADVVRRWIGAGHEVEVLTSDRRVAGIHDGEDAGVARSIPATAPLAPAPPPLRRPFAERAARRTVDAFLDGFAPDVVTVWNPAGLPLSAVRRLDERGVPTLFVVGDAWPTRLASDDPWTGSFGRTPVRRAVGRVAARITRVPVVVPAWDTFGRWAFSSATVRRQVVEGTGAAFAGSHIVAHGIDTDDFPIDGGPVAERPWRWRLLFVGRLDELKGIDTLVRAMALLPAQAVLHVYGPDEHAHVVRVRAVAEAAGVAGRVRIEHPPRHELPARYRDSDVCVFPSEWDEPFGLVPLEAMACSTPVVASGTGGSGEYLRDGENCVLAAPGDPAAIAAAVERLAGDAALRLRLVELGRATASSFTIDRLADRLEVLADDVAMKHRPGA